VRSRLGLVALWVVFAAASVGVGFGAAGLVGDPFTDPGGNQVTLSGDRSSAGPSSAPSASSSSASPSPSHTRSATPRSASAPAPVVRSLTTRGGLVVGSCSRALVTVSAAPTVGWEVEDLDGGPAEEARVRFERTGDGDGRVEVRARCAGGLPRLSVEDRTDNSGPGGGSSGGGGHGPG
jgi:hypothetical protein